VSGGKLCTQKSFENLMVTLQEMDQEKRKAHRKIPLSAIREAFQEQIALQISLSSRYGLSAAEASKGMVFETFRTCMHRLFYRPLEKEEDAIWHERATNATAFLHSIQRGADICAP
ncbi:unnamed protein product, partial [Cladocopium goreaui]